MNLAPIDFIKDKGTTFIELPESNKQLTNWPLSSFCPKNMKPRWWGEISPGCCHNCLFSGGRAGRGGKLDLQPKRIKFRMFINCQDLLLYKIEAPSCIAVADWNNGLVTCSKS